jgi:hypothetical protein
VTTKDTARYFLAFGKVIESDIDLPLLTEISRPGPSGVEARIVVTNLPVSVPPVLISRDSALPVTLHRDGNQVVVALRRLGWLARLRKNPVTITLHPNAEKRDQQGVLGESESRVLADRVVTNVLPYLPQLWGKWGIHGAFLKTPAGAVMLLAPSGSGKSTLSHVLASDHGWQILDDDTSMMSSMSANVSVVPMGAKARLREDAAKLLGVDIDGLESYGGLKGLLRGRVSSPHQLPEDIHAFISLNPNDGNLVGPGQMQRPQCVALTGMEALHSIFESMFSLESDLRETLKDQLALSAELSQLPHVAISYRKGFHTPEQTAKEIVEALGKNLGLK